MGIHIKKWAVSGLAGAFLAVSLGAAPEGMAATGKSKPRILPPNTLNISDPENQPALSCVQKSGPKAAKSYGYISPQAMRRISTLAAARDAEGKDITPVIAIAIASYQVGVDFDLMVMKATIESRMGEFNQPFLGGNARGLFHFMPATWLTLFKWFGADYNNGVYADAVAQIKFDGNNEPYLDDPELKDRILALRYDPYIAAYIKARDIREDQRPLMRAVLGREPTYTDFYVAHFLGLERAKTFFRLLRRNPKSPAADIFTRESEDPNNKPLFYKGRKKLSVQQVYNNLGRVVSSVMAKNDRLIENHLSKNACVPPLTLEIPANQPLSITPAEKIIKKEEAEPAPSPSIS